MLYLRLQHVLFHFNDHIVFSSCDELNGILFCLVAGLVFFALFFGNGTSTKHLTLEERIRKDVLERCKLSLPAFTITDIKDTGRIQLGWVYVSAQMNGIPDTFFDELVIFVTPIQTSGKGTGQDTPARPR